MNSVIVKNVDLHSHILPGVDDGAHDLQETLDMLRVAESDGTSLIVATPHARALSPRMIYDAVTRVNDSARDAGLAITVAPGSEVRLSAATLAAYRSNELVCINHTPYVLIELPFQGPWTADVFRAIHDLQLAGAWPILAHAERYQAVQRDPRILLELVALDVLLQVNAGSLLGEDGTGPRRVAESLARSGILHIIASDAHGTTVRGPRLAGAFVRLADLAGGEHAAFVRNAARSVVAGAQISIPSPRQLKHLDRTRFPRGLWDSRRGG
ncbi:MAG TPA: CpsB/CapC family capsule biosynthesis tyrosine phosphatase [Thermomicrobiales bacterium]|nr:CpsB/CapC family capsule biosynthesis tyrosine phosphatase [Thermomicrobiales bacterium]